MRVLIAYDGSKGAQTALELTRALPWPAGTHALFVQVVQSVGDTSFAGAVAGMPSGVTVDTRVIHDGNVARALVEKAREFEADLIITGHRGHGPMTTAFLGSVARDVADYLDIAERIGRGPAERARVCGCMRSNLGELFERDELPVATRGEAAALGEDVGDAAAHAGGEVAAGLAQHHDGAAGHVLAAVIADAFDDRKRAAIANGKTLAGTAGNKKPARGSAVKNGVSGEHVTAAGGSGACEYRDSSTGEALTDVVIRFARER